MEDDKKELEVLNLQKQILIERQGRLFAEFELTKRDLVNVEGELRKKTEEEKQKQEKENVDRNL